MEDLNVVTHSSPFRLVLLSSYVSELKFNHIISYIIISQATRTDPWSVAGVMDSGWRPDLWVIVSLYYV